MRARASDDVIPWCRQSHPVIPIAANPRTSRTFACSGVRPKSASALASAAQHQARRRPTPVPFTRSDATLRAEAALTLEVLISSPAASGCCGQTHDPQKRTEASPSHVLTTRGERTDNGIEDGDSRFERQERQARRRGKRNLFQAVVATKYFRTSHLLQRRQFIRIESRRPPERMYANPPGPRGVLTGDGRRPGRTVERPGLHLVALGCLGCAVGASRPARGPSVTRDGSSGCSAPFQA